MVKLISAILLVYTVCSEGAYLYEGGNANPEVYKEKRAYDLSQPHLPSIQETCERVVRDCRRKIRPFTNEDLIDLTASLRQTGISPICTSIENGLKCLKGISKSDLCFNMVGVDAIKTEVGKGFKLHKLYCVQLADEIEANKECIFNWNVIMKTDKCFSEQVLDIRWDPCNTAHMEPCVNSATADTAACGTEARQVLMQILTHFENSLCSGNSNPETDQEKRTAGLVDEIWNQHVKRYDLSHPRPFSIQEMCEREEQDCLSKMSSYMNGNPEDVMAGLRQTGIRPICTTAEDSLNCLQRISKSDLCINAVGFGTNNEEIEYLFELHNMYCDQLADEIEANKECLLNWNVYKKLMICFNQPSLLTDFCSSSFKESCMNSATADIAACHSKAKDILMQTLMFSYKNGTCSGTTNVPNFFRNLML